MILATLQDVRVRAADAALAWPNASIAASQDEHRPLLFRTVLVEFFPAGVQFVSCDGTMLFRTWVQRTDIGDLPAPMPEFDEPPDDSVIVMDTEKFALGFMRTLAAAIGDDPAEMELVIEPVDNELEPALGEVVADHVLTLRALGQQLSCKLLDGAYPDWRRLQFGMDSSERVDGLVLATRLFQSVGKLKGVTGIDCAFTGDERMIVFKSQHGVDVRGFLMPMRRDPDRKKKEEVAADQLDHEND